MTKLHDDIVALIEREAIAYANHTKHISDPVCPRDVTNPGLFFGHYASSVVWAARCMELLGALQTISEAKPKYYEKTKDYFHEASRLSKIASDANSNFKKQMEMK